MDRNELGMRGEDAAIAYLERAGLQIVDRNWRCPAGEIDIVALDGTVLVICEVKTRRSESKGSPEEAVSAVKRRRLARLAAAYLQHAGLEATPVRFDVVSIRIIAENRALLRHHRAAFETE